MAGVTIVALFNISTLNEAMGMICGPLYIICSFVGIMLYLAVEPAFIESLHQFRLVASKGIKHISNDISHTKREIVEVKNVLTKNIKK